jgi:uncharacterized protein (DUF983 family)
MPDIGVMSTVRWSPDRAIPKPSWPVPPWPVALGRGLVGRCPGCGKTHLFRAFLKVVPVCPNCGAPLGLARADDAPPYFTILITGHIIVPSLVIMQKYANPPTWELTAIFLPLTLILALGLLQPVKGAIVGVMLALGMLKPAAEGE